MKVTVNKSLCTGHAMCAAKCPEVYKLDDTGYCDIPKSLVPAELEHSAELGARCCPEGAITVHHD